MLFLTSCLIQIVCYYFVNIYKLNLSKVCIPGLYRMYGILSLVIRRCSRAVSLWMILTAMLLLSEYFISACIMYFPFIMLIYRFTLFIYSLNIDRFFFYDINREYSFYNYLIAYCYYEIFCIER